MLPTVLVVVTVTSGTILLLDELAVGYGLVYGLILTAVNGVMSILYVMSRDGEG